MVCPPGLRLPLLGEWTTSFVSRMDMLALVVQQVLVSLFIFGPIHLFVVVVDDVVCVPSIEHSEGTPLGLMGDERRREHDERNRSNKRAERGLIRKLDHLDSTQFYSSPHKARVPRNEQKNRINEKAGIMSGWTIHRTPLPSWNSRKGRQVVLCCAC